MLFVLVKFGEGYDAFAHELLALVGHCLQLYFGEALHLLGGFMSVGARFCVSRVCLGGQTRQTGFLQGARVPMASRTSTGHLIGIAVL